MNKKKLTLGSLFDGSGGFPLGGILNGIEPKWASEVEPFPIMVTKKRIPNMKHLGDISTLNGAEIEPVDIITFGSPCFPKETLVLTDEGYKEISNIKVGMRVLTHKGRWRKVTAVVSKLGKTIILKGNHYGLECTPNHPIYSVKNNSTTEREWVPAKSMLDRLWAVPNSIDELSIAQPVYENNRQKQMPDFNEGFFYFVGRWLGDGWVRDGQRSNRPQGQKWGVILICDSLDKENELRKCVETVTNKYNIEKNGDIVKLKFCSQVFCNWLTSNFGKYAYGKELPSWVFGMKHEWRAALLRGLLDSDGNKRKDGSYRISTVSKKLAEGIRILGEIEGYSTSVFFCNCSDTHVIMGRTVNQRSYYTVSLCNRHKGSRLKDNFHSWHKVKSITKTEKVKQVFNLTVEEDNSYIADGVVVHNCQDMSVAGKRNGLDGSRSSLFYEVIRIIKEMRCKTNGEYPRFIVWENVLGAFSSNKGADFKAVLQTIGSVKDENFTVPEPSKGKWAGAGNIVGADFSIAWRTLDAQYWGVPQRRKRIYLVADFNDQCAGKILFESEGLSGDTQKGVGSWERFASTFKNCIGKASYGIDGYNGSIDEVISTLGVNCGMSTGRNGVIVLNDQGGNRIDITNDKTTTLRAEAHHPPCILESAGFCTEHSAKSRGIGFEEEKSPTLRAGVVPATVYENHSQDCRYKGPLDVAQTVSATYGMGGNNQPFVVETPKAYGVCSKESNSMKSDNPNSGFYEAETSRTIDTGGINPSSNQGGIAVVCVDQGGGKSGCNFYEEQAPTLTCTHGGEPVIAVQGSVIGRKEENGPNGDGINEDVSFTLNTVDRHAVAYGIDRGAFNSGEKAKFGFSVEEEKQPTMVSRGAGAVAVPSYSMTTSCFMQVNEEKAPTLAARDYKDPTLVGFSQESFNNYSENDRSACVVASGGNYGGGSETLVTDEVTYIVRRLTPTECALLQGFPTWWCSDISIEEPTEEEVEWWSKVFETHRKIVGESSKPKTRNQIIKWLKNPHSDSAEYKMWGNGLALPNVCFVFEGIMALYTKS